MLPYRRARVLAVALLAALLGALLPVGAAHAADRSVQGGRLDWGLKSSFQKYVTGPIANGNYRLTGGAATVGDSLFRFHSAKGSYDPDSGAFEARFTGGVHFTGHTKPDGSNELDLALSNPAVRISGGRGTLHADMVSKARGTGKVTTSAQVAFASLDLSGINMKGGGSPVALNNVPATLTAQGATAFAGFYTAGTPLDPISLSVDVAAGAPKQEQERKPGSGPSGTPAGEKPAEEKDGKKGEDKDGKKAEKKAAEVRDAAVDWGVRRTFREYVTGSIAQGEWTLSDGAQDGGALFRFPRGKGVYDAGRQSLKASFAGSVRFTGEHLDLTLAGVTTEVKGGKGTLSADVVSGGRTQKSVPLVTFTAKDFVPEDGLVSLTEAPATLTEGGAKAFGSMYKAGTAMDPVSLAVAVDEKAALPALPDLGSDVNPTPSAGESEPAEKSVTDAAPAADSSESSSPTWVYVAVGLGLLAAAGIALIVVRRRRTAQN
ncbi:HtaA domain-containing protein [Streptomyces sp. NPDC014894]|uniref:HtaA domain-containing protein n=1 Tax=Streptomyces sp. NPDC014894 TaxID=3364931 RepID=UPI00370145DB